MKDMQAFAPRALQQLKSLKRRRDQASVPDHERCAGLCSNGKRCTRRRTGDAAMCGTHLNNAPRGTVEQQTADTRALRLAPIEIQGIGYFVDEQQRLFAAKDVIAGASEPRVVGACECVDGEMRLKKE